MKSLLYASLALYAVQTLAMPNGLSSRQARGFNLTELLMTNRTDALLDRTGEKLVKLLESLPADQRMEQLKSFTLFTMNPNGGKVPDPQGAAPRRVQLPPRTKVPGAQTVKIRYGPYQVPSMSKKNALGMSGGLFNLPDRHIEKPCEECSIIGYSSGLEFPDGTEAPISKGLWLHHIVLFNEGPGRRDLACADREVSLPHIGSFMSAKSSERIWTSGNERTPIVFSEFNHTNVGYRIRKEDKFTFDIDLMNDFMNEDKVVYVTVTYDIVMDTPRTWDDAVPVWFDITNCMTSEFSAPKKTGSFTRTASWTSNVDGEIIGQLSHLHDGGVHLVLKADGKTVCDSAASYGGKDFTNSPEAMSYAGSAIEHVSNMKTCDPSKAPVKSIRKGQKWEITAYYDYDKYKGMLGEDLEQEPVMGLALMYVRVKK